MGTKFLFIFFYQVTFLFNCAVTGESVNQIIIIIIIIIIINNNNNKLVLLMETKVLRSACSIYYKGKFKNITLS